VVELACDFGLGGVLIKSACPLYPQ
jgi:hypothetical protein